MKKAYYAHCQAIYNTKQEARDIATIEALGFECVNPNCQQVRDEILAYKKEHPDDYMSYFDRFAVECDLIIVRALPDGAIPAGVYKEMQSFFTMGKPALELPSGITRRVLNVEQTREYLAEVGQR